MSNEELEIIRKLLKHRQKDLCITDTDSTIIKAVAYNLALSDAFSYIEQLAHNKLSQEYLDYLKERD